MTPLFKAYIADLAHYFKHAFNLTEYNLRIQYEDKPDQEPEGERTLARIGYDLHYLYITVYIYPGLYEYFQKENYTSIVMAICHEFCHHFVEPLYQKLQYFTSQAQEQELTNLVELCTQRITTAIMPFLPKPIFSKPRLARNKCKNSRTR